MASDLLSWESRVSGEGRAVGTEGALVDCECRPSACRNLMRVRRSWKRSSVLRMLSTIFDRNLMFRCESKRRDECDRDETSN